MCRKVQLKVEMKKQLEGLARTPMDKCASDGAIVCQHKWKELLLDAAQDMRSLSEKEAEETSKELASIDSSSKPSAAATSAQPRLPTSLPPLESRPRPGSPLPTINATPDASFKESFNKEKNERRTSDVSSHLDTCSTASANETERSPVVTEMRVLPPVDK